MWSWSSRLCLGGAEGGVCVGEALVGYVELAGFVEFELLPAVGDEPFGAEAHEEDEGDAEEEELVVLEEVEFGGDEEEEGGADEGAAEGSHAAEDDGGEEEGGVGGLGAC